MSTILRNLLAVLAILGVASAAPAAVLFSETFSYPDGHLASAPPDGGVSGGLWTVLPRSPLDTPPRRRKQWQDCFVTATSAQRPGIIPPQEKTCSEDSRRWPQGKRFMQVLT